MYKLQSKDQPERSIWLVGEKLTLGSDKSNDLVINSLGVDAFHAEIKIEPNCLLLTSQPGTCYVNGLPVDGVYELAANDEIRVGKERLLIIDPKQQPAPVKPRAADKPKADWVLVPDHAKLKQRDFSIDKPVTVGRSKDCEFAIPYKLLSREHAKLSVENGQLLLIDLGSANGCYVNGERVDQAKLKHGDKVAFAKLAFTVEGPVPDEPKKANSAEQMNKTIIRPAVNLGGIVERSSVESADNFDSSVDMDESDFDHTTVILSPEKSKQRWLFVAGAWPSCWC
ncbi:FHA domain-containing protein [Oceanicoccus sp. KOV_DT_Chl]|uniref:FHA domain-containing protein n=1 Tax=Oceanicoccus sp. KOV_DT_Chl TaxID=1904639 RepID=UPI000C7D68EB|nr:FHA domain-containing protein [Oceanicoccus sp. KOV_DT_Chl]